MAVFKCKICGGTLEIDGTQSVATCDYCGTKQALTKLDDERKSNLYDRANHFWSGETRYIRTPPSCDMARIYAELPR